MPIEKRESAKRDLIAQWLWYAENADLATADRFLTEFDRIVALTATQPEMGRRVVTTRANLKDLRQVSCGGGFEVMQIYYRPCLGGIEILRVLHGRIDLPRLFRDGSFS